MTIDLRKRQTVLVADDVPENIEALSAALEGDYAVKVASDGERVLKIMYSDTPPDLLLLDVMMPGLSGHEVCRRIKANPDRRRIPIIFVTSLDSAEDEALGLSIGAVDYITKPISPSLVRARVRTQLALYDQTRELEQMVFQRTRELHSSRQQIIRRLGRAAEFKDNETGNHVLRMALYSRLLGAEAGLGPAAQEILWQTAPMHDIGKIGIPDQLLCKAGPLSSAEWELMKHHPRIGAEIIGDHDDELLATAHAIALTHHERWDGKGYPSGLRGEEIPLVGRIVAIADVFDALLSRRPYKEAYSLDQTMEYLNGNLGRHFDPDLVPLLDGILPQVERIRETYADEKGAQTDLDAGF